MNADGVWHRENPTSPKRTVHITSSDMRPTQHQVSHSLVQLSLGKPSETEISLRLCSSAVLQWINALLCPNSLLFSAFSCGTCLYQEWGAPESLQLPREAAGFHPLAATFPQPLSLCPFWQATCTSGWPSPSSVLQKACPQQSEFGKASFGKCTARTILFPRVTVLALSHLILALLL